MSWSFKHDWFKKFVEEIQPGDTITISTTEMMIAWRLLNDKGEEKRFFISPYNEYLLDRKRGRLDQSRFYIENFVGYALTLRGLALSKPRILDADENRLEMLEKHGMRPCLGDYSKHPDHDRFFEELKRAQWLKYTILKFEELKGE